MIVLIIGHFANFGKIPWNSVETSIFCGKGQILQLVSKFRDPQKTVGPTDELKRSGM